MSYEQLIKKVKHLDAFTQAIFDTLTPEQKRKSYETL